MRTAAAQQAGDRWVFAAVSVTHRLPAVARLRDEFGAWFELADEVVPAAQREDVIASSSHEDLADLEAGALAVLAAIHAERSLRTLGGGQR